MNLFDSPFVIRLPPHAARLSWGHIFGNQAPVELEIGFGKGMFLLSEASARPHVNFVGIEVARKYLRHTLRRVERRSLRNVRLICGEAGEVLSRHVADTSLQALHIYFPDPWHKKRHKKRRLFGPGFLYHAARSLCRNGELFIATDYAEYFEYIIAQVEGSGFFRRRPHSPFVARLQNGWQGRDDAAPHTPSGDRQVPLPPAAPRASEASPLSHYERKYRHEGRRIYAAHYVVQR